MAESVLGDLSGDSLALAVRASAAASVDSGLLRRLRLRFLKESDAAIEAAVWRSAAVENETGSGISFSLAALTELRRRFPSSWVKETCDEIAAHHEGAAPLLMLEEQLVRHALANEPHEIDAALGTVLASLDQQPARRPTILHWANEALPRLPPVAQGTAAAWALALSAQKQFEREILPGAPPAGFETYNLTEYLPEADVPLSVRNEEGFLVFGGSGDERIDVPDTHPRLVVLDRGGTRTIVRVPTGEEVKVENTMYPVELRNLRGDRWRVRAIEEDAHSGEVVARILVLSDLCLSPTTFSDIEDRFERVNRTLETAKLPADVIVIAGDVLDARFADDKEFLDRVSSLVLRLPDYVIVPGASDIARNETRESLQVNGQLAGEGYWFRDGTGASATLVDRDGYRIGIVGLDTARERGETLEAQLSSALKGDVPALYREELDAAVLVTSRAPRSVFGTKATALDLFDAKLFGHGADPMWPDEGDGVGSFRNADDKTACGCLVELTFQDGKLTRRRDTAVGLDRIMGASDVKVTPTPRKRGQRAMQRREIIRALRSRKSVLVIGATATGKTALIAEIVASPWLKIAKASSVSAVAEASSGADAVTTELDPVADMSILQEEQDPPLLLESSVLPFHDPPEVDSSWEVVRLGPLDRDDVLEALAHVDARKRDGIATWLIAETGGDPWLVWRAVAGARLRGVNQIESYVAPLSTAAATSVTDIDDPAALELLAALRKGPRWPVDRRAEWQLQYYGVAKLVETQVQLSSPVVGRVVTDEMLERLRSEALGDLPDDPEKWVSVRFPVEESWIAPLAMAIAHAGYGLQEEGERLGAVAAMLETLRSAEWVRIGGEADVAIRQEKPTRGPGAFQPGAFGSSAFDTGEPSDATNAEVIIPPSLGPDQVYVVLSEALDGISSEGRSLSQLLDELGCYDAAFVTVRPDLPRKAAKRTRVAEVLGWRRITVSDVESRRLRNAGARLGRAPGRGEQQIVADVDGVGEVDVDLETPSSDEADEQSAE